MIELLYASGHIDPMRYSARQIVVWYSFAVKRGYRDRAGFTSDVFMGANSTDGKTLNSYVSELQSNG